MRKLRSVCSVVLRKQEAHLTKIGTLSDVECHARVGAEILETANIESDLPYHIAQSKD